MAEVEIYNKFKQKLREIANSETKEKLKIRENSEKENYIEKLRTAKNYALESALYGLWGGLIGCGMAASILVGIGIPLQKIVEVLPLSLAISSSFTLSFAISFYYGYKNEAEKTKRK
jgi:hypothetical protein